MNTLQSKIFFISNLPYKLNEREIEELN